jgi:preprotein translocase subunit YajC
MSNLVFFSQAAEAAPNPLISFAPILLLVFMFFIMIRSQRRQEKERLARIAALKTGDEVIAAGGIHGLITNVADRTVTVKIADNVKITVEKASVIPLSVAAPAAPTPTVAAGA